MILSEKEINRRKPVWSALSDLWLDIELDDNALNYMADILVKSGYSIDELRLIYENEVAPVVYENLLSPAGEYVGFNEAWLYKMILASLQDRGFWARLKLRIMRKAMFFATDEYWQKLIQKIEQKLD